MRLKFNLLVILAFLFLVSCSKDKSEDVSSNFLKLDKESLNFSSEKGTQNINVETASKWKVISSSEWIVATPNENEIVVEVSENKETKARKGWILVMAGNDATFNVDITQAAGGEFIVDPNTIEVGFDAGSKIIDVVGNNQVWEAKTDADWITLNPKNYKYELHINYLANEEVTKRTAEITILFGDETKVITVNQKALPYYILPSFTFASDPLFIKDYEAERKSRLTHEASSKWYKKLEFKTRSSLFTKILYDFDSKGRYEKATIYGDLTNEIDGFKVYLEEKGFEKDPSDDNLYYNAEEMIQAEIDLADGKVYYTTVIKQSEPMATFTTFPYGIAWYSTKDEVATYEAANGGVIDPAMSEEGPEMSAQLFNVTSTDPNDAFARVYGISLIKKTGLHSKKYFYKNVDLAFFKAKDENYYLTKEFTDFLSSEGFNFLGTRDDGYHLFVNAVKNTNLLVRASIFKENNNVPVLELFMLAKDRNN